MPLRLQEVLELLQNYCAQGMAASEIQGLAYSPAVPGCAAAGDTEHQTRHCFRDALQAHFEAMREIGDPIPHPSTTVDYVKVAA